MTAPPSKKPDGFEQREALGNAYWDDPRWAEVRRLRQEGKQSEANGLTFTIRESWGVE